METLIIIVILVICAVLSDSGKKWVRALGNGVGVAVVIGMVILTFAGLILLFGLFGLAGAGSLLGHI